MRKQNPFAFQSESQPRTKMAFLIFLIILAFFDCLNCKYCNGQNGLLICCAGFFRNQETGECDECLVGYFGPDCMQKCSYPTYGKDCQQDCSCKEFFCDFAKGCIFPLYSKVLLEITTKTGHYKVSHEIKSGNKNVNVSNKVQKGTKIFHTTLIFPRNTEEEKFNETKFIILTGVVVTLFGSCVSFYVLKKLLDRSKQKRDEIEGDSKYANLHMESKDIQTKIRHEEREAINEDAVYLYPVLENSPNYEEIDEIDSFKETKTSDKFAVSNVSSCSENELELQLKYDDNLYLTPTEKPCHVYVYLTDEVGENVAFE